MRILLVLLVLLTAAGTILIFFPRTSHEEPDQNLITGEFNETSPPVPPSNSPSMDLPTDTEQAPTQTTPVTSPTSAPTGNQPTQTQPAPVATKPSMPIETIAGVRGTIIKEDMRLEKGVTLPLTASGASFIVTSIKDTEVALQLRKEDGGVQNYTLKSGATRLLPLASSFVHAIELTSILEDSNEITLVHYRYPAKKIVTSIPHTTLLLPGQSASITTIPGIVEQMTVKSVDRIHADVQRTTKEGGIDSQIYTGSYQVGHTIGSEYLTLTVAEITSDSRYEGGDTHWGPHVVSVRVEGK